MSKDIKRLFGEEYESQPVNVMIPQHIAGGKPSPLGTGFFQQPASDQICGSTLGYIPGTDSFDPPQAGKYRALCETCSAPFDVTI